VDCNVAWVLASILGVIAGMIQPTGLGVAFVLAQAAAVAALAALEAQGLRPELAERAAS
jgi:hypothetical protein